MKKILVIAILLIGFFSVANATIYVAGTYSGVSTLNGTLYFKCTGSEGTCATIGSIATGGVVVEINHFGTTETYQGDKYQLLEGDVFGMHYSSLILTGVK
jgi:hypothetical protein